MAMIPDTSTPPWADTRLPPVYIELPEPAGAGLFGRRKALYLNAGLNCRQIGPLLVPKLTADRGALLWGYCLAAIGVALFIAAALGVQFLGFSILGLIGAIAAFVAFSCFISYNKDANIYKESGQLWDEARALVFNRAGDKLINLGAIESDHARADITAFVIQLSTVRASLLRDHQGDGPVTGEQELLRALEAVGEYARRLQGDQGSRGSRTYSEVADSLDESRAAALEAIAIFVDLDRSGFDLLDPVEQHRIVKGTRK